MSDSMSELADKAVQTSREAVDALGEANASTATALETAGDAVELSRKLTAENEQLRMVLNLTQQQRAIATNRIADLEIQVALLQQQLQQPKE